MEWKTQKARGMIALKQYKLIAPATPMEPLAPAPGLFIRPCQGKRENEHGWIVSRVCQTQSEIDTLRKQVLTADPDAELMGLPFVKCQGSAIWVPPSGILTCGPGHDGATGGGPETYTLYLPPSPFPLAQQIREYCYLKPTDAPYIELLAQKNKTWAVQMRPGPVINMGRDFIPEERVAEHVLVANPKAHTDLEWREMMLHALPGTVVRASSLVEHFAILARMQGIPVVTSRDVTMGETIKPETGPVKVIHEVPPEAARWAVARGIEMVRNSDLSRGDGELGAFAMACIHAGLFLLRSPQGAYLLMVGATVLADLAYMLCSGEARFLAHHGEEEKGKSRNTMYDLFRQRPEPWALNKRDRELLTRGKSGYGGKQWLKCQDQANRVWSWLSRLTLDGGLVRPLIDEANTLTMMVHNGGMLFNKIMNDGDMNLAATDPGKVLATRLHLVWGAIERHADKEVKLPKIKGPPPLPPPPPPPPGQYQVRTLGADKIRLQAMFKWHQEHDRDVLTATFNVLSTMEQTGKATGKSMVGTKAMYIPITKEGFDALMNGTELLPQHFVVVDKPAGKPAKKGKKS